MKQDAGRLVVGAAAAWVGVTVRGALVLAVRWGWHDDTGSQFCTENRLVWLLREY